MNVKPKTSKLDWKKVAIIAVVLGIAAYNWYTNGGPTDSAASSDDGRTTSQSVTRDNDRLPTADKPAPANNDRRENKNSKDSTSSSYLVSAGGKNLQSPAGLIYTDSRSEHRADHVLRHADDIPNRSGPHGVFHADGDDVFRLIDEAYELVKSRSGQVKTTEQNDGKTVYVIDMKRKIGFRGGREGQRQNHPQLNKIKLVLGDNRVITAYPY